MNGKTEIEAGPLDTVKLVAAALILIAGIAGYYLYPDESVLLRVGGVVAALIVALLVAFQSTQGKELWRFIQGSRVELRKVVWPNQQETLQTTLMVFVFVLILGVFFWLLDKGLVWITRFLTGQGG